MANKAKYSALTAKKVCEGIAKGLSRELAASRAGVCRMTVWQWSEDKPEFTLMLEQAEAQAAARWLDQIETAAADGNWQAAAWKLERRFPDTYGQPKVRHEVTVPNGISYSVEFITPTALASIKAGSIADSRSAE